MCACVPCLVTASSHSLSQPSSPASVVNRLKGQLPGQGSAGPPPCGYAHSLRAGPPARLPSAGPLAVKGRSPQPLCLHWPSHQPLSVHWPIHTALQLALNQLSAMQTPQARRGPPAHLTHSLAPHLLLPAPPLHAELHFFPVGVGEFSCGSKSHCPSQYTGLHTGPALPASSQLL